jgi:hypothetical protein
MEHLRSSSTTYKPKRIHELPPIQILDRRAHYHSNLYNNEKLESL